MVWTFDLMPIVMCAPVAMWSVGIEQAEDEGATGDVVSADLDGSGAESKIMGPAAAA